VEGFVIDEELSQSVDVILQETNSFGILFFLMRWSRHHGNPRSVKGVLLIYLN